MEENKKYFDNINGIYVKDSEAREDITDISGDITTINGDITTINGTLTTLNSYLNINNFESYNNEDISYSYNDVTIPSNNRITVATNSDGSLAKIYGYLIIYNPSDSEHLDGYISLQSSLRPEEDITINSLGTRYFYSQDNTDFKFYGGYTCDVTIKTTGEIRFFLPLASDMYQTQAVISPCLLFVKNFGDTPIDEEISPEIVEDDVVTID